ncbi:hypothetical protein Tco_1017482 [Tanacetum coccineum]|uniref:Uncharacterized protein n=1 Tax=Tanacetum coccineum TaxID=301880 RepID=A0ABQ5FRL7_9ASTR
MESSFIIESVGDNSRAAETLADSNLVSDVVQAMKGDVETTILDELRALLPSPDAPTRGGGRGGCEGGDPEGVDLSNHVPKTSPVPLINSCDLHEPGRIYL